MISWIKLHFRLFLTVLTVVLLLLGIFYIMTLRSQLQQAKYDAAKYKSNYESEVLQTKIYRLKTGEIVAEAQARLLKSQEIIDSKEKKIQELVEYADKLNLKVKDLEFMISIAIDTTVHHDTKPIIIHEPGTTAYKEYDTLRIDSSYIYRLYDSKDSLAHYSIHLGGSLFVYFDDSQKEGKWKLVNLFKKRETHPIVTVTSNNSLLNLKDVKMVVVDKGVQNKITMSQWLLIPQSLLILYLLIK